MRIIVGKQVRQMDAAAVADWTARYPATTIDLGAGDGRFVRHLASRQPGLGVIGVDLCAANLALAARAATANALFVVADALALPDELGRVATRVTMNFPWGSLLRGLLSGHPGLIEGLGAVGRGAATVEISLNAAAFAASGWTLEAGGERVAAVLRGAGAEVGPPRILGPAQLRRCPTTWAKRLAFGRDPRAIQIDAVLA